VPIAAAWPIDGSFIVDQDLPFQCSTNTSSTSAEVMPVLAEKQLVEDMQLVDPNE
jgi:hypothetical protein